MKNFQEKVFVSKNSVLKKKALQFSFKNIKGSLVLKQFFTYKFWYLYMYFRETTDNGSLLLSSNFQAEAQSVKQRSTASFSPVRLQLVTGKVKVVGLTCFKVRMARKIDRIIKQSVSCTLTFFKAKLSSESCYIPTNMNSTQRCFSGSSF